MVYLIGIAALVATLLGGFFALRYKDKLHLILGFSAGAVIAVAFFELLPEAIELGGGSYGVSTVTSIAALGFAIYLLLDRLFVLHANHEHEGDEKTHAHTERGTLGASSLSFHSFLDGLAIGLAFQVSAAVGATVAVAVLVHDFSDGINTVNLVLKNAGSSKKALLWLTADAVAPIIGIIVGSIIHLEQASLGLILALFCGFFLYIGASDLLPESHHSHPTIGTTCMTILGMLVLFTAIQLASL